MEKLPPQGITPLGASTPESPNLGKTGQTPVGPIEQTSKLGQAALQGLTQHPDAADAFQARPSNGISIKATPQTSDSDPTASLALSTLEMDSDFMEVELKKGDFDNLLEDSEDKNEMMIVELDQNDFDDLLDIEENISSNTSAKEVDHSYDSLDNENIDKMELDIDTISHLSSYETEVNDEVTTIKFILEEKINKAKTLDFLAKFREIALSDPKKCIAINIDTKVIDTQESCSELDNLVFFDPEDYDTIIATTSQREKLKELQDLNLIFGANINPSLKAKISNRSLKIAYVEDKYMVHFSMLFFKRQEIQKTLPGRDGGNLKFEKENIGQAPRLRQEARFVKRKQETFKQASAKEVMREETIRKAQRHQDNAREAKKILEQEVRKDELHHEDVKDEIRIQNERLKDKKN